MLGSTMVSFKKLAKKVKVLARAPQEPSQHYCLLREFEEDSLSFKTPTGFFALYVGENHQRFVVPTSFLSHPLFKMLLEKSYSEFGFEQSTGLVVPCSVSTFEEVLNTAECSNGKFDFGKLVKEFI
ncbi:Indole-3-acetic acid-induced protein ARG7 [Morella rubra]|uniref:Indole-3-acetic acid-induced protein ARG7 n=1 Tax=Morella rubra TaxID=262757 RepID=A0A6A1WBE6_9ROSI|nr:Indole-3-acetic acid-induced protein ARG7 [Morella rubra]